MGTILFLVVITLVVALTSLSVGLGEGLASMYAVQAINQQPRACSEIRKTLVLGTALTETAAISGLVIALILLTGQTVPNSFYPGLANLGIAFAICLPGIMTGLASAFPTSAACLAIARQPFFSNKIINLMLITVSFIQTPIVFGFIIAFFASFQTADCTTLAQSLKIIASGLSLSLGAIGPLIGLTLFATTACRGVGLNRAAYRRIFSFTVVSEALIETPLIFALVIALLIITTDSTDLTLIRAISMVAAALAIGLTNIAPGISSGRTASAACREMTEKPHLAPLLSKTSLIAQGIIDSFAIYGWAIALFLILFV